MLAKTLIKTVANEKKTKNEKIILKIIPLVLYWLFPVCLPLNK